MERARLRERLIGLALFVVVSSAYFATASGLTSTNEGSHYALLRAMADEGRFQIDTYVDYTDRIDYARRGEHFYSDRPPGTAVIALPFYLLGRVLPAPPVEMPSFKDAGNPALPALLMLPALAAAGVVVLLYLLLRRYELSPFAALTTTLAFAFGSTMWKYGGALYSHALAALLALAGVVLAFAITRTGRLRPFDALLLGFVLCLSVVVEYASAVLAVAIALYVVVCLRGDLFRGERWARGLIAFGVGAAIPAIFMLWYNAVNFGSPLAYSYQFYAGRNEWSRSLATTFDTPLLYGLRGMLFGGEPYVAGAGLANQGLFVLMPVTLLGLVGIVPTFRRNWREAALLMGLIAFYLVLSAKNHNFSAGTSDGRYMVPYLAYWFVPVAFALQGIDGVKQPVLRSLLLFVAYGLIVTSVYGALLNIAMSYNYQFEFSQLSDPPATLHNWRTLLGAVFVNVGNLPLLWLVEGVLAVFGMAASWLYDRMTPPAPAA